MLPQHDPLFMQVPADHEKKKKWTHTKLDSLQCLHLWNSQLKATKMTFLGFKGISCRYHDFTRYFGDD